MATYHFIYWRPDVDADEKGEMFANIHILVGYNQGTIVDFQKMADELRKTFLDAKDEDITAGKVISSSFFKGFSIITWNTHIPKGDYPGWQQKEDGKMEYGW